LVIAKRVADEPEQIRYRMTRGKSNPHRDSFSRGDVRRGSDGGAVCQSNLNISVSKPAWSEYLPSHLGDAFLGSTHGSYAAAFPARSGQLLSSVQQHSKLDGCEKQHQQNGK
jgi:hypothetical protein